MTERQLVALARAGFFERIDFVYAPHVATWVRADSVHGLFDEVRADEEIDTEIYVPGPGTPAERVFSTRYASIASRLAAALVDMGALLAILAALVALSGPWADYLTSVLTGYLPRAGDAALTAVVILARAAAAAIVLVPLGWLYFAWFESSRWQATPGKRLVGLMVATARDGDRLTFARASLRYGASLFSAAALCVGFFMAALTRRGRTFHDLVADTVVVYGRPTR